MKTIPIGYCSMRNGLALLTLFLLAISPVFLYFAEPKLFSTENKTATGSVLFYGVITAISLFGFAASSLKLFKFRSSKEALLIYREGFWSNVSGIQEKFVPWASVERAYVKKAFYKVPVVIVDRQISQEENQQRSFLSRLLNPGASLIVSPLTVAKYPFDLAERINEYALQYEFSLLQDNILPETQMDDIRRAA